MRREVQSHQVAPVGASQYKEGGAEMMFPGRSPIKEPPNAPQKPPVEEPGKTPKEPPPGNPPPVEEPPNDPKGPPVKEPPPEDPDPKVPERPPMHVAVSGATPEFYPPSQNTTGLPVDECKNKKVNATARCHPRY